MIIKQDFHTELSADLDEICRTKPGIRLEIKKIISKFLHDQQAGLAGGDGCISNPGGPGC